MPQHKLPKSFKFLQKILCSIPYKIKLNLIGFLAKVAKFFDKKRTFTAKANLDLAFGDSLSENEKQKIIYKTYENLIAVGFDTVCNQGATKEQILSKVRFHNEDILKDALKSGKKIIFLTAHYGNWELGTLAIAAKYTPIAVVGRPLDNSYLNTILTATREQFGVTMIPKKRATKAMIKALLKNTPVGLVVDQNTRTKDGILIEFFGKETRHTPSAAILARKFDALVIPVYSSTNDYKVWDITFYKPLEVIKSDDIDRDIHQMVQLQADITQNIITKKPDEWLWLHQRWKNRYPQIYRR